MKEHRDTFLTRVARVARPSRAWLSIESSRWWTQVLLAGGARQRSLAGEDLLDAPLRFTYLVDADLHGANLAGADLRGATLNRADLSGANLTGADLSFAHLNRADLSRANLAGSNLTRADLSEADLSRADLTNADLTHAYLTDADLVDVVWSERTRWPESHTTVMQERSVPIGGGRYRVQGSGSSGADLEVPLVPVS